MSARRPNLFEQLVRPLLREPAGTLTLTWDHAEARAVFSAPGIDRPLVSLVALRPPAGPDDERQVALFDEAPAQRPAPAPEAPVSVLAPRMDEEPEVFPGSLYEPSLGTGAKRGQWSLVVRHIDGRIELAHGAASKAVVVSGTAPWAMQPGVVEVGVFTPGGSLEQRVGVPHRAYAAPGRWTVVASAGESWLRWVLDDEAEAHARLASAAESPSLAAIVVALYDPSRRKVGSREGQGSERAKPEPMGSATPATAPAAFREGQRVRVRAGMAGIDGVPVSLAGEVVTVASVGPKRVKVRPDGRGKTYAVSPRALDRLDDGGKP